MFCDLHMHSTASDGTNAPRELATIAKTVGLGAIALTDHDTTAGLPECASACAAAGIEFVPGIEISADPCAVPGMEKIERLGTLHILGLFVQHDEPKLLEISRQMSAARDERNPAIVERLKELGVAIEYEEVQTLANDQGTKIIGRPHIAQVLINKGYVKTIQDAFRKYIGMDAAAYVRRDRLHPRQAIDTIHAARGLAIVAHPIQLGLREPGQLDHFIERMKDFGLDGIETRHSDHAPALVDQYEKLAAKLNLLTSGGSDYHGSRKSVEMGGQNVPFPVYERLRHNTQR